ncbi:PfkB family carbohydrate kinase [Novosphingobium rosa]|uniref:PfkB family carbohydrate kinase n=1 Tax=Novosphingobium rosa TaxID=76978 RepID=UPI000829D7C8|nr:PfkB family carbohydrate kinase [Novosphingobium rosa]
MTRILGLGDNTIDTYVDAGVQYPGGNAVNVAAMTARLGATTAYLGCVGDDEGGTLLCTALAAEGIDISRVRTRPGANARAFIGHVAGDRQFISSSPGVRADYRWEEADFAYMAKFDHIHTSIYSELGDALPKIAASTQSLSLDGSNRWTVEYLQRVLPFVRFLFLSASELTEREAMDLATQCLGFGPQAVVLTRGSDGAMGMDAHGTVVQPAVPTAVVDTLGAGDGFISGFLTSMLSGGTLKEAMTRGAGFAAQVCGWQGGFGHEAPWIGDAQAARATASR